MKAPLYFRYHGIEENKIFEIPMEDFGRSLIGFDRAVKDFSKIVQLNGKIEVKAISFSEGSLIIKSIVDLQLQIGQLPFDSIGQLQDFLRLVSESAWRDATNFFNDISNGYRSINEYFMARPFDLTLYTILITTLLSWIQQRNNRLPIDDDKLATRIDKELHSMVNKGVFDDALRPMIEESVSSIEISSEPDFSSKTAKIDSNNINKYLSPNLLILPELENGHEYTLEGTITSLKSTRGESITFHYVSDGKAYNLEAVPNRGISTKEYVQYYKEYVILKAKIERNSYYTKPKLHIIEISYKQPYLDL